MKHYLGDACHKSNLSEHNGRMLKQLSIDNYKGVIPTGPLSAILTSLHGIEIVVQIVPVFEMSYGSSSVYRTCICMFCSLSDAVMNQLSSNRSGEGSEKNLPLLFWSGLETNWTARRVSLVFHDSWKDSWRPGGTVTKLFLETAQGA